MEWEKNQQSWWEQHYARSAAYHKYHGMPGKAQGIRHYYAEKLFQHLRPDVANKLWIDIGAGTSSVIADLIHPLKYKYRYVATDISKTALKESQSRIGQTPILSVASHLPFKQNQADVVSIFGVLQYVSAWQDTLHELLDLLKPKGYVILTSNITKPRICARWRKASYTAEFDAPDYCIDFKKLNAILTEQCEILLCDYSGSPLRFALFWFGGLDRWALRSYPITQLSVALDKVWLATAGKLARSLGPGEITMLARKH